MSTAAKAGRTAAIPPTSPSHRSGTAVNRVRPLTVRFEPLRRGPGLITLGSLGGSPWVDSSCSVIDDQSAAKVLGGLTITKARVRMRNSGQGFRSATTAGSV